MKQLLFFVVLALANVGVFAAAADDSKQKNDAPAAADSKSGGDSQPADKDEKDNNKDKDEAAPDADKKPASKKNGKKAGGLKLTTADEAEVIKRLSYMQGYELGKQLSQYAAIGVNLDHETLFAAFKDAVEGKEPTMTDEERKDASVQVQKLIEEKQAAKIRELAAKNKAEGKEFLAENKKKEGVKALPSGLQYKVLKSGKGEKPRRTDTVKAHYKGTLLNGTEFDSSYRRGQPALFPVGGVIPGWTEALQLMKVGDKWQLYIPAELAYGEKGAGNPFSGGIPPSATLVFEVELLGIEKGGRSLPPLK